MAYFECTIGGSGTTLTVTCDSEFAGSTISCSDGTNTMTAVCPSVSPYEVEFMISESGTWEISATVGGETYTTEVVVDLELEAALEYGFGWRRWVTAGGLDPSDYEDLEDVFSDEAAVRRLMTVHASADYLITCVTDDIDTIDDFTANDTAMKWIGLRDYVCDGLSAITGVEAKFLASEYWERYLKDHVPIMTSATAPYGTVIKSSDATNYEGYHAFDDTSKFWQGQTPTNQYVGYGFVTPCVIKKFSVKANNSGSVIRVKNFKLQACNDSSFSNAVDLGTYLQAENSDTQYYECNNDTPYNFYRIFVQDTYGSSNYVSIDRLQFYGRSLNVSVPVMTSNTAPYGTAIKSAELSSGYAAWKAFDGDSSTLWYAQDGDASNIWIGYDFGTTKVNVNKINALIDTTNVTSMTAKVQGSNTGNVDDWHDVSELYSFESSWGTSGLEIFLDLNEGYSKYRLFIPTFTISNQSSGAGRVKALQFYGVDYSEKEFDPNTTKKWLYDHGLELNNFEFTYSQSTATNVTHESNDSEFVKINITSTISGNDDAGIISNNTIDISDYNLLNMKDHNSSTDTAKKLGGFGVSDSTSAFQHGYPTGNATARNMTPFVGRMALDISNVNQSVYIGVGVYSNNAGTGVTEINMEELWLE